jgi:mannosyltransferase
MTASTITRVETARRARIVPPLPTWADAVAMGLVGFVASFIGVWNPSLWGDEAASIMSAERPLPSLFRMLGNVDAVHGTYYLLLHYWIGIFGTSELSVRLPSTIAVGILVAGVYVLGRTLGSRRLGIVAAIVCAVIPRISSIGADARSYAISTAIAVWLTVLLVTLSRRGATSRRVWIGYALGLTLGLYVFLYLGLLIAVHGLFLLLTRQARGVRRRWAQASVLAVVLGAPVLYYGYAERDQIAFLAHRNYAKPNLVLISQWFGDPLFAAAAWLAIALAVGAGILALRRRRVVPTRVVLVGVWLVVPTALLLALNTVTPTYNLRYLAMSTPAAALAIAMGLTALRRRWLVIAATLAVVLLALPSDIAQRQEFADDQGSDWRQVSQYVAAHSNPGDAILFDETVRNSRLPRLAMRMYPQDYRGLSDVELVTPFYDTSGLWDKTAPLDRVAPKLATTRTVLLLELRGSRDRVTADDVDSLESLGYELKNEKTVNRTVVYIMTRGTS